MSVSRPSRDVAVAIALRLHKWMHCRGNLRIEAIYNCKRDPIH